MTRAAWSVLVAVGCYGPAAHPGSPCDQGACSSGLVCELGLCVEPTSDAANPDAPTTDAHPPPDAMTGLAPFKTPVAVPGINTGATEDDPTFSADRLTIMFTRGSAAAGTELWMGTRATTGDAFTVAIVTELNSTSTDQSPELSADGLTVYFTSSRSGSNEVYTSTRTSGQPWATPTVATDLSTTGNDSDVGVSPDGLTAIVVRIAATQTFWRYQRASVTGTFGNPTELTKLEIASNVAAPSLTNGAATVYFHSGSVRDLYVSRLAAGVYSTPVPVTELNTSGRDASPYINAADDRIVFDRDGDLYEAAR